MQTRQLYAYASPALFLCSGYILHNLDIYDMSEFLQKFYGRDYFFVKRSFLIQRNCASDLSKKKVLIIEQYKR